MRSRGLVYLDYTGAAPCPESVQREHLEALGRDVFGNPHSTNPAAMCSTRAAQDARAALLEFLDADPGEYEVVWTSNASAALRLVGEKSPVRRRNAARSHRRQSQHGERHSGSGGCPGRSRPLSAAGARPAGSAVRAGTRRKRPLRVSGPIELLRRPASARVGRSCAGARLSRPARCRRVPPDASLFTAAGASRLRRALDLQDVRLPDRGRRARRQARRAACAGQAGVLGRDRRSRVGVDQPPPVEERRRRFRGRDGQLPGLECRAVRSAPARAPGHAQSRGARRPFLWAACCGA